MMSASQVSEYMTSLIVGMRRNRLLYGGISDKGNGKEAGCNGRTESNGYDEMDRIDE